MQWSNEGDNYHRHEDFQASKHHLCLNKCCELAQVPLAHITGHRLNLTGGAGFLHAKKHWFVKAGGEIKKLLNSSIANNRPSLLKLQQALIGFKVMKKTTWSIIIKVWCRHVRAQALCCEWWGWASSTGGGQGKGHVLGATIHPPRSTSHEQQYVKCAFWFQNANMANI